MFVSLLTLVPAFAVAASGMKPFQKEAKTKFDEEIADPLQAANTACGVKLALKIDFENLKAADWEGNSISSRCAAMLNAVAKVCAKPAYKDELTKAVKEVACLFNGKKPGDGSMSAMANMSVKGKAFTYKMHKDDPNLEDAAQAVIEKALNE